MSAQFALGDGPKGKRPLLNNNFTFLAGFLDQSWCAHAPAICAYAAPRTPLSRPAARTGVAGAPRPPTGLRRSKRRPGEPLGEPPTGARQKGLSR